MAAEQSTSSGTRHDWLSGPPKIAALALLGGLVAWGLWRSVPDTSRRSLDVGERVSITEVASEAGAPTNLSPRRVDLNTATAADLELLPGIGPQTAARIVQFRDEAGGFRSVDELQHVRGVGRRTIERLRDHVTCGVVSSSHPE